MAREKIERLKELIEKELAMAKKFAATSDQDFKISSQAAFASPSASGDRYFAETQADLNKQRLMALEGLLSEVRVCLDSVNPEVITVPCHVVLADEAGVKYEYFLAKNQVLLAGIQIITPTSPLGASLVGKRIGETVEYPSGEKSTKLRVEEID